MSTRALMIATTAGAVLSLAFVTAVQVGCGGPGEVSIEKIEPQAGHTLGDQPVKIVGHGFRPDIGYTVYFGTKKSPSVTIMDEETILVTTPSQDRGGEVDIHIRADDGSAFRIANAFRYSQPAAAEGAGAGAEKKGKLAF